MTPSLSLKFGFHLILDRGHSQPNPSFTLIVRFESGRWRRFRSRMGLAELLLLFGLTSLGIGPVEGRLGNRGP
jgi:hypothetical protein